MRKIGIITFHASHNYGSMLQAYALQQTVKGLGYDCKIINFRTQRQKHFYRPFFLQNGIVNKLKAIKYPGLAIDDIRKHLLFEKFLKQRLELTPVTYETDEALKAEDLDFDCYISGSDQIWNTICFDFDTAYFLDFVKKGQRVAYAPSMGPTPDVHVTAEYYDFITKSLSAYDHITVREELTARKIKSITGKDTDIVLDPTFLLDKEHWSKLAGDKPLIKGEYILLYTPWYSERLYEAAYELAGQFDIDIIATIPDYKKWSKKKGFRFYTAVGPEQFLNLIKNARFIVSGSFHAVVFSIIFGRPFWAFNGMDDSRMAQILRDLHLEEYAEKPNRLISEFDNLKAEALLKPYIEKSLRYIEESLS